MTDSVNDLRDTIVPKSDQLNADDLLAGPITVRVKSVRRGDRDQPVAIHLEGAHQPYKPCKSMRRVLIFAWGNDGAKWAGRSMTLYCDPEVVFGGVKVGGIRISHLSDISEELLLPLTVSRGRRAPYKVQPLVGTQPATTNGPASSRAGNPDADYLRNEADQQLVKDYRRALFGNKKPLTAEEVAELAKAVRAQEPPETDEIPS